VIVLTDIKCEELEALIDYMYLGESNIHEEDLPHLLKAAESLRVKGLWTAEEDHGSSENKLSSLNQSVNKSNNPISEVYTETSTKRKRNFSVDDEQVFQSKRSNLNTSNYSESSSNTSQPSHYPTDHDMGLGEVSIHTF